jgi:hypothetical protein
MQGGFASIRRDSSAKVHGVLYDLAFSDVGPLDRYEEVTSGLYRKLTQPVLRTVGGPVRALVYVGGNALEGKPKPGYLDGIIAAGRSWNLPEDYLAFLQTLAGGDGSGVRSGGWRAIKLSGV